MSNDAMREVGSLFSEPPAASDKALCRVLDFADAAGFKTDSWRLAGCVMTRDGEIVTQEIIKLVDLVDASHTALAAPAQSDRAAILEEAAVLLCEVSQKYKNLEIIDALQEVAGVLRTRLARGSLAIAVEYAKRQSSTSAQSVEPVVAAWMNEIGSVISARTMRDCIENGMEYARFGERYTIPLGVITTTPSAEGARDAECSGCNGTGLGGFGSGCEDCRGEGTIAQQILELAEVNAVREAAFREVAEAIQKADPSEAADVAWDFVGRDLKSKKEA